MQVGRTECIFQLKCISRQRFGPTRSASSVLLFSDFVILLGFSSQAEGNIARQHKALTLCVIDNKMTPTSILLISLLSFHFEFLIKPDSATTVVRVAPTAYENAVFDKNKTDTTLATGFYFISTTPTEHQRLLEKSDTSVFIRPNPILTFRNFVNVSIEQRHREKEVIYLLTIYLDAAGEKKLFHTTLSHIGDRIAFIVNDKLIANPIIVSAVADNKIPINRNVYSLQELKSLEDSIKANLVNN